MTKQTTSHFAKRYNAALRLHAQRGLRSRGRDGVARTLGRAALSLGLDSLALTRVHNGAVAELGTHQSPTHGHNGNDRSARAGAFLLAALTPLAQTQRAAQAAALRAQGLGASLRERDASLAVAQRQLQREKLRRRINETQLVEAAQHYRTLLAEARRMQKQSRNLAHQILLAQEEERKEISRELHDEVAQILAGINVQLATLDEAAAINTRSLRKRIAQTQRLVTQSVDVVHRYARELRPALLDDLGLIPALRSYIKDLPRPEGLRIRFTAFAGVEAISSTGRTALYRVAQEALTNVARHAHARLATVRIHKLDSAVALEVRDDGKSFRFERILASTSHHRLGLLGMRERIEMLDGHFSIASQPGAGTTIRAEIPFRHDPPSSHS